jgi:hypothetical protein
VTDADRLAALLFTIDGAAGGNRRLSASWAFEMAYELLAAGVTLAATPAPLDEGVDGVDCDWDERGKCRCLAATPAPLDVERLALALRAWRGDYGAPLAIDLPDAADLARCYAEAVKSDKPRTFDQYVRPQPQP